MKQGKTLSQLAAEIERQAASKKDYVADTRNMSLASVDRNGGGSSAHHRLRISNGEQVHAGSLTDHCHRQIGQRVGIPARYYDRMRIEAPELLADNVNTWFAKKPERRMIRTLDGRARAFLSDRYARIDNHDVCEAALPVVQEEAQKVGGLQLASCEVTERRMYVKFVTPRVVEEVKVGDAVQQGLVISNSEIGQGSLSITPMVFRLVCANGMVVGEGLKRHHVGARIDQELEGILSDHTKRLEDAATLSKVRDVVRAALDGTTFLDNVQKLRDATEHKIEGNPIKAIEVLADTINLSEAESGGVLRHLVEGGDLSQYGAVQAVTAFAQDDSLTYDRATELELAGGKVLELEASAWRRIAEAA